MKISFGEDIKRQDSGKHKFLYRLSNEFERQGHRIVDGKSDIFLHIGRNMERCRAKKSIMRVDGLILNNAQPFDKMNRKILKHINRSHAIIYQGEFCRDAFVKFLGVDKEWAIIPNGANPKEFLQRNPQNFFLTHCNWRKHKRLDYIIDVFGEAQEDGLDSELVIAGKVDKKQKRSYINYRGWIGTDKLKNYLSEAIATIHISWLDWCPNAVIESLVAGCPVVLSDSGGSKELYVDGCKQIADKQWDFKPCCLYSPPELNRQSVKNALFELKKDPVTSMHCPRFHIENIAGEYLDFFHKVLCS